jgi:hypothetical protein
MDNKYDLVHDKKALIMRISIIKQNETKHGLLIMYSKSIIVITLEKQQWRTKQKTTQKFTDYM